VDAAESGVTGRDFPHKLRIRMTRSGSLKSLALWVSSGVLASVWLYGAWHAYEAHKLVTAGLALVIPPFGMYMAVEADSGHGAAEARAAEQIKRIVGTVNAWCYEQPSTLRLNEVQQDIYCDCVAQMFIDDFPVDLSLDPDSEKHNPLRINTRLGNARGSCMSSVVYLGGGSV
jgi:hypothetical protein